MTKRCNSLLLLSLFICLLHNYSFSASSSKDEECLIDTMFVNDTVLSDATKYVDISAAPLTVFDRNYSINPPPIIDFTFSSNNVCSGQTISFTSTVTGNNPFTYAWDFGDGSTSTLANPDHSFQASLGCGSENFNVTLVVTDVNNDTTTISKPITIEKIPDISFEDVNAGFGVPFENCNQGPVNYTVTVGNTSNSSSCITSYSINWGDGTSASNVTFPLSHTYQTLGLFNMVISGVGSNGCQAQKVFVVKNSSNPQGGLSSPGSTVNLCTPMSPLQFAITQWGTNPIDAIYNVDYGDGTTFTLTQNDLVSSIYYNNTDPVNSAAYPIPHAYVLSNCPNTSYTVLLDIITSCGESNFTAGPITVFEKPEVSFNIPDKACINVALPIINTTTGGYSINCTTTAGWFWDMGDGTTYTDFEPIHSYSTPGTYTVSLYAENFCGTTNIITQQICIEAPLIPDFAFSTQEGCTPLNVATTNNTDLTYNCSTLSYSWEVTYQDAYCGIAPENWSYEGGTNATSEEPQFNFVTPGIYTLQATISGSSCGTVSSVPQNIIVKKPPTVSINSIADFCQNGINSTISPTAVVDPCAPDSNDITYAWSFPSGTPATSSQANPTNITYSTSGIYTVALVVTNECGTVTALDQTFEIFPEAEITGELTACAGQTSQLTASTSGSNWMSSDSSVATVNSSGLVTGGNAGNATITFTDDNGCSDSVSFDVIPAPIVANQPIAFQEICTGGVLSPVTFTVANGVGTPTYQWYRNLNNTTTSGTLITGATNVSFTPDNTVVGTVYYYCIITFPSGNCASILTNTTRVTIFPLPTITSPLNTQEICEGGNAVDLNVQATGGIGNLTYQWFSNTSNTNTGGISIPGANQATYTPPTFSTVGTFYYYAVATYDGSGCGSVASNVASINVVADPIVTTQPLLTQTHCQGANATALNVAVANGLGTPSYQWYSNTTNSNTGGSLLVGQINASFTPPTTNLGTLYYYCVITQSISGCETTSDTAEVIIVAAPLITSQPIPDQDVCLDGNSTNNAQSLQVAFTNGAGTASYQWYSTTTNATIGGSLIVGATSDTYVPPTDAVGELFYYCEITFSLGGCSSIFSNTARVEVHPLPIISTNPINTQDICEGGTSQVLSISTSGGFGNATYQWYSNTTNSNTSGGTAIAGANQLSYTPPVFTASGVYYFYVEAIFDGTGCGSTLSDVATINVVNDPIITTQPQTSQTQCQNAAADDLVVAASGGIGSLIYQWYSNNTASNTGGTLIAGASSPAYTPPTSTVGTVYYYCVITQAASGCEVTSNISTVEIVPSPSITTQPNPNQEICINSTLAALNVSFTNGAGTATYQWYSNSSNSTTGGTPISGATSSSYTPPSSPVGELFYYCELLFSQGGCSSIFSNTARVEVYPQPTIVTQPLTTQDICEGGMIMPLNTAVTGGTGTITYQWYSNTSNSNTGGTAISGATADAYTPSVFNTPGNFYFYAIATLDGIGCNAVSSQVAEVKVVPDPEVTAQPLANQTHCQGAIPNDLTLSIANGLGTISYQWYSNSVNANTGGTAIAGATTATYVPPTTAVGITYYYCVITQDVAGCEVVSATSRVEIVPAPTITTQPEALQELCLNGTVNSLSVAFTNGIGTVSYQWYSNTVNDTSSGTIISGATMSSYTPPNTPTGTVFYYCELTFSQGGCSSIVTNTGQVNIEPLPTISAQPAVIQDICEGGMIMPLNIAVTGGTGTITYQWYSNTTNSNTGGTAILGATLDSYTPPAFNTAGNFYYYAVASLDGTGCGNTVSDVSEVNVVPDPDVTAQPLASQTHCQGAVPNDLNVVAANGTGTFSYQWYTNSTNSNTGGTAIVGETNDTFTPPTAAVGTVFYYCEIIQSGEGCNALSDVAEVIVVEAPIITSQPIIDQTVCINGMPDPLTLAYANGTGTPSYQWYSNSVNDITTGTLITGATSSTYNPIADTLGETFYYCEITFSQGGCSSIFSTTARVEVVPLPTISSQPLVTQELCEGGIIMPLTVAVQDGTGVITYQWFSNSSNSTSGGTLIAGADQDSYTPATFVTAGTFYFYVVATLDGIGCGSTTSNVAEVIVRPDPDISMQPLPTQTHCQGAVPDDLIVAAANGTGTFSYQWYQNTSNSSIGGTLLAGANGVSFTPDTSVIGITYYYCEVTQTGIGCNVTSDVASVEIVPAPSFSIQPLTNQELCINGSADVLTVAFSNGTGTASYQWYSNTTASASGGTAIAGETNANFIPPSDVLGELFYYCEIMFSQGGCSAITSTIARVEVVAEATIATDPLGTQDICVGGSIVPLTVAVQDGAGLISYQWYSNTVNSNTGGSLISGATMDTYTPPAFTTSGNYYFYAIASFTGNGCSSISSAAAEVIVIEDPMVSSQPISNQTQCQGAASDDLVVVATGGLGSYSYQWYTNNSNSNSGGTLITGETSDTFTPPTNTVGIAYYYCEIVQTGLGCNVTSDVSVVEIVPAPMVTVQPVDSNVCEGDTVNLMNVAFSNGTATPNYQWFSNLLDSTTGGTPITGATSSSFLPQNTIPGTTYYYCEITFTTGGCPLIVSDTAEVIISQFPVIQDQNYVVCTSEVFTMDPNQGGVNTVPSNTEYTWTIISSTPTGVVNGATSEVTPQANFTQNLTNTTAQIGTVVYALSPIAGICTGNNFTVTIDVFPTPLIDFSIPDQTLCNQFSTDLVMLSSALPGNITYNWTANVPVGISGVTLTGTDTIPVQTLVNSTTNPLTVTYTATATFNTNGSSCEGPPAVYAITVNPQINASATLSDYNSFNVSFFGGSDGAIDLSVNGGSGLYSYSWTGPNGFAATTQDINNLAAGDYTVAIDDGVCPPVLLNFTLTQPPELLFEEDLSAHVDLVCFGDSDGALGIVITQDSVAPYTFEIFDSSGTLVTSIINMFGPTQVVTGLSAGIYTVRITDANGRVKELTGLEILQPDDMVITNIQTPITCYGADDATMTISVSGGNGGPYTAAWSNLATGFFQANLGSDNYDITVTDRLGCTKTATFFVSEAPIFDISPVVTNISCTGANDGSIALNFIGGLQPLTLTWSDGSTAGVNRNNLAPGIYSVTIEDGTPCFINETFTIVEPSPLVVDGSSTNAIDCDNATTGAINVIVSGGTPPFTYSWSNGATTEDLDNITSGNYLVTVTDSQGCTEDRSFTITRPSPIELSVIDSIDVDCATNNVSQDFVAAVSGGVPPFVFSWSNGSVSGANNEFMSTGQNGLITLTATDARGCIQTYNFDVALQVIGDPGFLSDSIGFSTYGEYSIQDPIQFTNTATGAPLSISWDFGDGTFSTEENPIHSYVTAGQYTIIQTVTYEYGCVKTFVITLFISKGYKLIMPSAFTPNEDNLNDNFRPRQEGLEELEFNIYDTWGSLIFSESGETIAGWDGLINGREAENGNYYYQLNAKTFFGERITAEGPFIKID